jgi:hypothetical protein
MEDYYYISKAENRSKAHGSNCDKLSFVDKFSFEKLHHQFCKAVLGIKKTSCNISAKSELGRLPLDSFIKTQVMLYYSRIQSDGINPLVKETFNINKNISNENIYIWYTFATEIFKEVELNKNNFEDFNKPFLLVKDTFKNTFKKTIKEKYEERILEKISNLDDSSKLFLYSKLKAHIKLEDYLKLAKNVNNRQLLTKFKTSDHPLEIELGRYKKIPRHQRLCKTCKVQDDEIHFFLQCQINNNLRNVLINNIKKHHANFHQLDSFSPSKNYINS